ncbi:ClpXP protease specificity-enhancing factor SspB [Pelagibacteraceae bacterium]|mgnify:CR=1 FL=1|nr:ClpXP protease specificity-enhancing factor SspB [Pelagibacteraceae bacterium]
MIEYNKILNKNMINVLKDILKKIKDTGLSNNNHLYITFSTIHNTVKLPNWIRKKYPEEMTIVIQYEYYDLEVNNRDFSITLSFNDIKTNLVIGYNAIISFADPSENFGLILQKSKIQNKIKTEIKSNKLKENNVINFSNYKKNQSK